ncbi:hypothetical protein [Acinetobacter sp. ANC 3813]|uniref:hypothetical protein n=1 Tax=Acinetobacter sp. ANC 3813 TaxID=1977873 RepID=UPI000A354F9A|nr:hypothetical protein [Acinetobacter sp. ANC 3813]OTG87875.1 hypothetical protein B9T34_16190 [Acinetobacter sp. ANC 3813]
MPQICISFPPPSYDELVSQLYGAIPDLPTLEQISALIGIPCPIYLDISQYTNEISQIIQYWQSMLSVKTLLAMIQPMVNLLGLNLAALLPKIPYLNLNIMDLIALDANAVRAMIADALKNYGQEFKNALAAFLPLPIYIDLNIPSFEVNAILKAIYSMAVSSLIEICTNLIGSVLNKLKINALLSLPALPTLDQLQQMVMQIVQDKIAEKTGELAAQFDDEIQAFQQAVSMLDFSIDDVFALIQFPQLPVIKFPKPLFPDFSCLSFELREAIQIFMQGVMAAVIEKIVSFVKSVLSVLGVQFPSICISI